MRKNLNESFTARGLPQLLPLPDVLDAVSVSRSKLYALLARNAFPAPVKIGKSSRWLASDIERWIAEQAAARDLLK